MAIENVDLHSFLPTRLFLNGQSGNGTCFHIKLFCATAVAADSSKERSRQDLKKIIDKVLKHVCGHAPLSDTKILLERNDLWSTEVEKYLHRIVDSSESCSKTHEPKKARKVSLSSLNRSFNELVSIDHFHLGNLRLCHIMCASTRYSIASVVPNTGMEAAIHALEAHWISEFWAPKAIQFDQAFANELF